MGNKNWIEFSSKQQNPSYKTVLDVSPEEVLERKHNVQLIDVRRPDEWVGELGHIAGSELITLDTLPQNLSKLDKEKTIVFICRSGQRSANASEFAQENGFQSVYNMKGGMIAWNEKQFDTEGKNSN